MPPSRVREIFDRVVDLPGGERDGLLDRECAGDGALRESVVSLLAAHDGAGEFLAAPAISSDELRRGDDELPAGSRVGAYTIEKKLGEGGFDAQAIDVSRVWVAPMLAKSRVPNGIATKILVELPPAPPSSSRSALLAGVPRAA